MLTTATQWRDYCEQHITAGYTPGGNARATYDTGLKMALFLYKRGLVHDGMNILDVGCGNGRLAMGLLQLDLEIAYTGLDVILPCIEFCRGAFSGYNEYGFQHLEVYNAHYWPNGMTPPDKVIYPARSSSIDLVTAFSLFSHTQSIAVAERNLAEMRRVLYPGGSMFTTWSFTTLLDAVKNYAEHTVYHFNDVLSMLHPFGSYQFVTLEMFKGTTPNQVGIWTKI